MIQDSSMICLNLLTLMTRILRNLKGFLLKEESNMRFNCSRMRLFLTLACIQCQFWRTHKSRSKFKIWPSTSPCGSPIVLVPEKDGTWCMCVDFIALNKIMVKNRYPLPHIDDLLDKLKEVVYFTKLYLRNNYHQIRIAEDDIWKNYFKTKQSLFEDRKSVV